MQRLEHGLELLIFNSRWLLAPIYVGLVLSVLLLLVRFVQEFVHIVARMFTSSTPGRVAAGALFRNR